MNKSTILMTLTLLFTQSLFSAESTTTKKRKAEPTAEYFQPNKKQKTVDNLILGLKNNNLQLLTKAVKTSRNLNKEFDFKLTPLIYAAEQGNLEAVKLLASHGADINLLAGGYYPLLSAAMGNQSDVAHYLLDKGALVNQPSSYGTPLGWAIENSNPSLAMKIIEKNADLSDNKELGFNYLELANQKNTQGIFNEVINLLKEKKAPTIVDNLCSDIDNLNFIKKTSSQNNKTKL